MCKIIIRYWFHGHSSRLDLFSRPDLRPIQSRVNNNNGAIMFRKVSENKVGDQWRCDVGRVEVHFFLSTCKSSPHAVPKPMRQRGVCTFHRLVCADVKWAFQMSINQCILKNREFVVLWIPQSPEPMISAHWLSGSSTANGKGGLFPVANYLVNRQKRQQLNQFGDGKPPPTLRSRRDEHPHLISRLDSDDCHGAAL
jgi:hypothetical protein